MASKLAQISTVGVVGSGVIGVSWAALFLSKGLRVIVADPAPNAEQQLQTHLKGMWPSLQKLGLSTGASLDNCRFAGPSISPFGKQIDFVQENGPERPDIKISLISELDKCLRPEVVIASSSSGLPSSRFVSQCLRPERVLIGHPFNPPHLMPLVEVVPHPKTSQDAVQSAIDFYKHCGKTPVHVRQETPGFAANRLQAALASEAYSLVHRGILTAEEVDIRVTNSLGPRYASIGPFMSAVLGGGDGGFKHLMNHVGAASKVWTEDMKAHALDMTPSVIDDLDVSVQEMLKNNPADKAAVERDEVTMQLLKTKKEFR